MALSIRSSAFAPLGSIPQQFTRTGANVSPPLEWQGAPQGTRSFALIVEDPDAPQGTFHHWLVYDIPTSVMSLPEGAGSRDPVTRLRMGRNDFGNSRYDGPQPPPGDPAHRYRFRLLALGVSELDLPARSGAERIWTAARKVCLEDTELVGLFEAPGAPRAFETQRGAIHPGIADADKLARTGGLHESIRNTPPAGAWNDIAANEERPEHSR